MLHGGALLRWSPDFYIVADLYAHARNGGDVLAILERIAPGMPAASKEYWAAEQAATKNVVPRLSHSVD